jgi:hypothetical protein
MITNFLKFKNKSSNVAFKEDEPKNNIESIAEEDKTPTVLIEIEPYAITDFKQKKHKVYLTNGTDFYYLGDIRKFSIDNKPLSYLQLNNIRKVNNIDINTIRPLTEIEINSIKQVFNLDSTMTLMDDRLTYADKFEKELNIKVIF